MEQQLQYDEKTNSTLLVTKQGDILLCEPVDSEEAALLSAKIKGY